jgi:hypothetical protein
MSVCGTDPFKEDPATKAARKRDWDSFPAGLSERDLASIQCLVDGEKLSTLARTLGCWDATRLECLFYSHARVKAVQPLFCLIELFRTYTVKSLERR